MSLLMAFSTVGSTRVSQIASGGLRFSVSHIAFGSGGVAGNPAVPVTLAPSATALTTEVFRKEVAAVVIDTIATPRGKETVYTTLGGDEYAGTISEAALFAVVEDAGTTGLTVGTTFLLVQAHFPQVELLSAADRLALTWPLDFGG